MTVTSKLSPSFTAAAGVAIEILRLYRSLPPRTRRENARIVVMSASPLNLMFCPLGIIIVLMPLKGASEKLSSSVSVSLGRYDLKIESGVF